MAATAQPLRATERRCPIGIVSKNILLLGTTGSGKSSTGNSILLTDENEIFRTSNDCESCTTEVGASWNDYKVTDSDGGPSVTYRIKVIDGPGLRDTNLTKVADKRRSYKNIAKVLRECEVGIHAFVFVVRLSVRFTQDDKDAYDYLKRVLGDNFMEKYGVVVVAGYDYLKNGREGVNFPTWCDRQTGFLEQVFKDCNYRCVAFDNETKEMSQKKQQLETLLEVMHEMEQNNKEPSYTTELFERFATEYKKAMRSSGYEVIKEDFRRQLDILKRHIKKIETEEHLKEAITALMALSKDVQFEVKHFKEPKKLERHLKELEEILKNINGVEVDTKKFKSFCKAAHEKIEDMHERASYGGDHCFALLKIFRNTYWRSYF